MVVLAPRVETSKSAAGAVLARAKGLGTRRVSRSVSTKYPPSTCGWRPSFAMTCWRVADSSPGVFGSKLGVMGGMEGSMVLLVAAMAGRTVACAWYRE